MYKNLIAEMARAGVTRKGLAQELGIAQSTLYTKMYGSVDFTFGEAMAVKKVLGVDMPLEVLFENDNERA